MVGHGLLSWYVVQKQGNGVTGLKKKKMDVARAFGLLTSTSSTGMTMGVFRLLGLVPGRQCFPASVPGMPMRLLPFDWWYAAAWRQAQRVA